MSKFIYGPKVERLKCALGIGLIYVRMNIGGCDFVYKRFNSF